LRTETIDGFGSLFDVHHGVEEQRKERIKILVADSVDAGLKRW
jgi:hypothetical protein